MATLPMTACEWRVGDPGLDEMRIVQRPQIDGRVLYAVTRSGWVANKDREWEYEVQPSSRDDEFIAHTRWADWESAASVALHMARTPTAWNQRVLP